jgi:hypothetical protein
MRTRGRDMGGLGPPGLGQGHDNASRPARDKGRTRQLAGQDKGTTTPPPGQEQSAAGQ